VDSSELIINLAGFINDKNQQILKIKINKEYKYQDERFAIVSPINGILKVEKTKNELALNFRVNTKIILNCDLCLKEIKKNLNLNFYKMAQKDPKDNQILIDYNNKIDIFEPIWEQIILEIPAKIICKKNCRGLCSICGQNLNKEICSHCQSKKEEKPKNPFSILKKLKKS